jgi:hypothetical protein
MQECESMMPVSGESSAAVQLSAGSSARAALPPRNSSPAVDLALLGNAFDLGGLLLVDRNDQFADLFVRHAVRLAKCIQQPPALHAVLRAQ